MTSWLFPANVKFYDVMGAFEKSPTYWPMNGKVVVGDVVYIYLAAPHKQLAYKTEVLEIDLEYDAISNAITPFITGDAGEKPAKPFIALKNIQTLPLMEESLLGLAHLKENGLKGMLMGARKLDNNPALLQYIEGVLA